MKGPYFQAEYAKEKKSQFSHRANSYQQKEGRLDQRTFADGLTQEY